MTSTYQLRTAPRIALAVIGLGLLLQPGPAIAGSSDVELFSGGGQVPPNIVILLDNSGSMDRDLNGGSGCNATDPYDPDPCRRIVASNAIDVLVNTVNPVVAGTREENARFGLMTYVRNGSSVEVPVADSSSDDIISSAYALGNRVVRTPLAGSLLDVGRYYAGTHQWDRDGTGSGVGLPLWGSITSFDNCASCPPEVVLANPIDLACRDSFIIFITDGRADTDEHNKTGFFDTVGDSDGDLGVGETSPYEIENAGNVGDASVQWGDDISHAMYNYDFRPDLPETQNVITHMIGFTYNDPYLERIADNGGGQYYFASDAATLGTALDAATREVFDRFADFSTAVVPTSRTLSGSAFYNVYFEPSRDPVWQGHVEAYRLSPAGEILDADGDPAIDSSTGELLEPHNAFWDAATGTNGLDNNGSRTLYTTLSGARVAFDATNASITTGVLNIGAGDPPNYDGPTTQAELRAALMAYVHGKDSFDDDGDTNRTELRSNALGDIFHSTPSIVSAPSGLYFREDGYSDFFTAYEERDRVIYVGANDGMLHAFDAGSFATGDDPDTSGTEGAAHEYYTPGDGDELFGYVPGLLLDQLKRMPLNYPRTFYYVDGSPTHAEAWLGDGSGTDTDKSEAEWASMLVTGFREGGPGYLALDVTDPGAVSGDDHFPYPKLLWEFTHSQLGQAWSQPIITRVKLRGATSSGDKCGYDDGDGDCREQWVMIVGGGYLQSGDPNLDGVYVTPSDGGWTPRSKAIFMIALDTGSVLAKVEYDSTTNADMVYSIPSSQAVLDLDVDGFADVVYIGDLGGQLWKWDISAVGTDSADADSLIDNWIAGVYFRNNPIDIGSGVLHYRSFFFPPAAAYDRGVITLAFGSGEREDLRYGGASGIDDNNRFYVVKDQFPTGAYAFVDAGSVSRLVTESDLSAVTSARTDTNLENAGFYFVAEEGEKFTSDVLIFAGHILTTSYTPNAVDICTAASGLSYLYVFRLGDAYGFYDALGLTDAESRRTEIGPGLASSPRVSMGPDPSSDKVVVKSSKGKILLVDPPERETGGASVIYWRQKY